MSRRIEILVLAGALALVSADARAQAQAGQTAPAAKTIPDDRPATTTIMGDTGLWFVPAGEVLKDKQWSASAYFINWDVAQGSTDISHYAGTFGYGIKGRAEIFGAVRFITRIDRDTRPIFNSTASGGIDNGYPLVHQGWTGNQFGDTFLGVKVNLASQSQQKKVAFAIRPMVKLPGSSTKGASTGKVDFGIDAIVSKELPNKKAEVSGTIGYKMASDPSEVDLANSLTWGFGAQFPTRKALRFTAELYGEKYSKSSLAILTKSASLVGDDGSTASGTSDLKSMATLMVGGTWQNPKGFFFGVGGNWSLLSDKVGGGNNFGGQVRIGFHPPIAATPLPAPPPPPAPAPPPPPPEHTLTLRAQANPPTVEVGQTSQVTATAQDSIGCTITYRWSAASGTFANAAQQNTVWTAPNQTGTVPVTVTGTCASDQKTASATVNITVVARPVQTFTFEDVYFDFDRYSLTDAAQRILAQALDTLRANPGLRIRIEGHTCSIGTAEYNLALGDRRARSVLQYLVSSGIAADRLTTVSFGEENPKYDNSREETRRLNRRAALTVQIVAGN